MRRAVLLPYGVAVVASAVSLLLVDLLWPVLDRSLSLLGLAAVMVAAWYGGLGPGLLAVLLTALTVDYLFLHPVVHELDLSPGGFLRLGVFVLVALLATVGNETLHAARRRAEAAQERLALLAEASAVLASSVDSEAGLVRMVQLAVPYLADWCFMDLRAGDGVQRVAAAHRDPSLEARVKAWRDRFPLAANGEEAVARVLRTGQAECYPDVTDAASAPVAESDERAALSRELHLQSFLVVPLVARGEVLGVMGLAMGRSGRRYRAADLALAEDLARRAAVAIDNARLFHAAQQALQERDDTLVTVSHDLKNPLTVIKGQANLLQMWAARMIDRTEAARLTRRLATIDVTASRMAALIGELLDAARLEAGKPLDLDLQPTDLVALARQVMNEQQAATQRHHLRLHAAASSLVGDWDPARLARVLVNLLVNAIKYSPNGGEIVVTIARQEGDDGLWAVLTVQDQGLGIPAVDLPHIFERFQRAGNVARQVEGSGIGLAIAREIVEQHGGTIAAASREGHGSRFTVRLPLSSPHAPQPETPDHQAEPQGPAAVRRGRSAPGWS